MIIFFIHSQIEPPENYSILSKPSNLISYETPPQLNTSPKLPELTQGRKFLPLTDDTISDSDLLVNSSVVGPVSCKPVVPDREDDFDKIQPLPVNDMDKITNTNDSCCTTNQTLTVNDSFITPHKQNSCSSEAVSNCEKDTKNDDDDLDGIQPLSNDEISATNTNEYSTKNQQSISTLSIEKSTCKHIGKSSVSSQYNLRSTKQSIYSEIKYLETIGILRTIHQTKHRGICNPNGIHGATSSPSSTSLSTPTSTFDRTTKIKIAYRIRKTDGEIQYTLIIYEHVTQNPKIRRNLMQDFMDTIKKKDVVTAASIKKRKQLIDETKQARMKRFRF